MKIAEWFIQATHWRALAGNPSSLRLTRCTRSCHTGSGTERRGARVGRVAIEAAAPDPP